MLSMSSCFDLGLTLMMYSINSCHRFSIGLRSGDSGGVGHQLMYDGAYLKDSIRHIRARENE